MPITLKPNDTSELGRAVAAIPGLVELVDQADRVRSQPTPDLAVTHDQVIAATVADVRSGNPVDFTEVGARLANAARQLDAVERGHNARRIISASLDREAEYLVERNADVALTALAVSLDELLDQARAAARALSGATTAEDVLAGSRAQQQAWRDLDDLATRYAEIRTAQSRLTALVLTDNHGELLRLHGWLRGQDEIWARDALPSMPPWPYEERTAHPENPRIGPALIRWLVTFPGADPWLPTTDELAAEQQAAAARWAERNPPRKLTPDEQRARNERRQRYAAMGPTH